MEDIQVGNSQYIRDLNLIGIFRLIHKYGPVSRKELAENTGYSAATISNHVKRLLENDFVVETDKGSSTGGRRPVHLTVNPKRGYILSVDIKVNYIRMAIFNLNLEIREQSIIYLEREKKENVLDGLNKKIRDFCQKSYINIDKIIGMGIALPGLVDNRNGFLHFAPNLEWENINIKEYFQRCFNFPVFIDNEAKAAVLGEREFVYPEIDNIVFVSINEGIGCGIMLNGELYRGASGNAGEFGHIIINSDGPKCHCGNNGCWETLASINFIINSYLKETEREINSSQLKEMLLLGNQKLLDIVKKTAKNIAVGLVNIINSLSPEMLVIGGDIIDIKEYLAEDIDLILSKRALAVSHRKVNLTYSQMGKEASLFGIAKMVFDNSIEKEMTKKII